MEVIKTAIEGVFIIEPRIFKDARGYFFESFSQREFEKKVGPINFVQDNESMSSYGVMRGLHFQRPPYTQSKLVRCVKGAVLDVAVDIRKGSPTFGKAVLANLTEDNKCQFFIPRGFAHGFYVFSEEAVFEYKCDNYYNKESEDGIRWDDKDIEVLAYTSTTGEHLSILDIFDGLNSLDHIILSEKDKNRTKTLKDL